MYKNKLESSAVAKYICGVKCVEYINKKATYLAVNCFLRKEGDSNPRYPYEYVSLANWWFQPLTHPSLRADTRSFCQMRCKDTLLSQFVQIFETFSFVYFQFFLQRLCFQWVCCHKKMRLHPQVKPQLYFVLSILFGGFQPAVEPTDKCAVEKHTVLGLENPVIFIGEDEQLGRNAT